MSIRRILKEVESSSHFARYREENPDAYLVHAFSTSKDGGVELGYYDREADKIAVFETDPVKLRPPEDVFKQSGVLQPLDLDAVGTDVEGAREACRAYAEERHPQHPVEHDILILQQADRPVWNCTLVTQTLNMLIVQLDATTGDVRSAELRNILDLRK